MTTLGLFPAIADHSEFKLSLLGEFTEKTKSAGLSGKMGKNSGSGAII